MNFLNPGLLAVGAALAALPVLIHLFNRRRPQVVDWAAMDFLFEADRRSRRRLRFENLLLTALRCAAVALIALVVGRPTMQAALTRGFDPASLPEQIVVLDDSLSMQATNGAATCFDVARDRLVRRCREWADDPDAGLLTLFLASKPDAPVVQGVRLAPERIDETIELLLQLEPTDGAFDLRGALRAIERDVDSAPAAPRRLHLITDLRRRDWLVEPAAGSAANRGAPQRTPPDRDSTADGANAAAADASSAPREPKDGLVEPLLRLARRIERTTIDDVGAPETGNLVVTSLSVERPVVAGVPFQVEATLRNAGESPAKAVELRLAADDSLPQVERIDMLGPGESTTATFTVSPGAATDGPPTEAAIEADSSSGLSVDERTLMLRAEAIAERPAEDDRLVADNVAWAAARVERGARVLVVDGDPSSEYGRSESFYAARALAPPGSAPSGLSPQVATVPEFETRAADGRGLDAYQAVLLCNVGEVSDDGRRALEDWVRAGGGAAFFPGDAVRAESFNRAWRRDGAGLSPVALQGVRGDESERTWTGLQVDAVRGGFLSLLAGADHPLLRGVRVFRWWAPAPPVKGEANRLTVLARWTDAAATPAVVERSFGRGRVVWFGTPVDADWSTWADDPSFVVALQELVRRLARPLDDLPHSTVGRPIEATVDIGEYRPTAQLTAPDQNRSALSATAATLAPPNRDHDAPDDRSDEASNDTSDDTSDEAVSSSVEGERRSNGGRPVWRFASEPTVRRGVYALELTTLDGLRRDRRFAVNVDPMEGDLRRVARADLRREFGDAPIEFLDEGGGVAVRGGRTEVAWYLAWIVAFVLGVEQWCAGRFGGGR